MDNSTNNDFTGLDDNVQNTDFAQNVGAEEDEDPAQTAFWAFIERYRVKKEKVGEPNTTHKRQVKKARKKNHNIVGNMKAEYRRRSTAKKRS